jgi:hypothetical protein
MHEALYSWAGALLLQSRRKPENQRRELLEKAKGLCLRAEGIKPGSGAYNLACIASLSGDFQECEKWLNKANEAKTLPKKEDLETDKDLDPVRHEPWFRKFLDEAC